MAWSLNLYAWGLMLVACGLSRLALEACRLLLEAWRLWIKPLFAFEIGLGPGSLRPGPGARWANSVELLHELMT